MSLYNAINGVNPATFLVLPMLGMHPDEYPRFRDCFVSDDSTQIQVLTRTGGGNREEYESENQALKDMPEYVTDENCDWDTTFALWTFNVPDKWKSDFQAILTHMNPVSEEYIEQVEKVYPKIADQIGEQMRKIGRK